MLTQITTDWCHFLGSYKDVGSFTHYCFCLITANVNPVKGTVCLSTEKNLFLEACLGDYDHVWESLAFTYEPTDNIIIMSLSLWNREK